MACNLIKKHNKVILFYLLCLFFFSVSVHAQEEDMKRAFSRMYSEGMNCEPLLMSSYDVELIFRKIQEGIAENNEMQACLCYQTVPISKVFCMSEEECQIFLQLVRELKEFDKNDETADSSVICMDNFMLTPRIAIVKQDKSQYYIPLSFVYVASRFYKTTPGWEAKYMTWKENLIKTFFHERKQPCGQYNFYSMIPLSLSEKY